MSASGKGAAELDLKRMPGEVVDENAHESRVRAGLKIPQG
jgi:hypothetical protein